MEPCQEEFNRALLVAMAEARKDSGDDPFEAWKLAVQQLGGAKGGKGVRVQTKM